MEQRTPPKLPSALDFLYSCQYTCMTVLNVYIKKPGPIISVSCYRNKIVKEGSLHT